MPRSKRNKEVSLTKVKKKDLNWKKQLVEKLQAHISEYPRLILFKYTNFRTSSFQEFKEDLKGNSRFFLAPNSQLRFAFGRTEAESYQPNLHVLGQHCKGYVGLLCTKMEVSEAVKALKSFSEVDYARSGQIAKFDVSLPKGPVQSFNGGRLPHTLEPMLRKYGLPTKLNRGVIELIADHQVCLRRQKLNPNQACALRLLGIKMSKFRLVPVCCWENGVYEEFECNEDNDELSDEENIEEMME